MKHTFPTLHPLLSYLFGLGLSVLLTLGAYLLATLHVLHGTWALGVLLLLALLQCLAQLIFFLHVGAEPRSRERLVLLGCAFAVVCILVGGSLWIMTNLNGRMMPSSDSMIQYMQSQEGI